MTADVIDLQPRRSRYAKYKSTQRAQMRGHRKVRGITDELEAVRRATENNERRHAERLEAERRAAGPLFDDEDDGSIGALVRGAP